MIRITQHKTVSKSALKELVHLVTELRRDTSEHRGSVSDLKNIVTNKNAALVVAKDNAHIVGMGTLYIVGKIGKRVGYIEDVVVSSNYRGQGLGEKIMRALIVVARKNKLGTLFLTSHANRPAANNLYMKLGFEIVETNPYKLKL